MIGPDLRVRLISGVVMALAAILSEIAGGWWFGLFWTLVFVAVAVEWQRIIGPDPWFARSAAGVAGVVFCGFLSMLGHHGFALAPLVVAAAIVAARLPEQGARAALGIAYAGLPLLSVLWLRSALPLGLEVIAWVFGIVWAADIAAYFAGRAIGGPKLWPSISPKKTWSGFAGGTLGGALAASLVLLALAVPLSFGVVLLAGCLAVLSAAGDLFESALKRRFNVKDSGRLIPGHGGVMDRVDGFIAVVTGAGLVALMRGGDPGAALLLW
jgi:phosphatidate cytidylyltransferase